MSTLIKIEFRKLLTIRSPWLFLLIPQLIVVGGISGLILSGDPDSPDFVRNALAHAGVPALITMVLGITAVASEYRHRTITDAYLATPRRGRLVVAKLVTFTVAGTVIGLCNAATALVVSLIALPSQGVDLDLGSEVVWRTLAGGVAYNTMFAAIGVSLGALIRNLTGAIVIALAWIAVVEGIVGQLVGDLARWLPNRSAFALGNMSAPDLLPQWGGGVVLIIYVAAFIGLAVATTVRRDVT